MQRQSFLHLLRQYQDNSPLEERETIEELMDYVSSRVDCFDRKPEEGARHIAASVLLVTSDFRRALFLWHAKIQRWTQPGGHADGDPNIRAVALRELGEEVGVIGVKLASPIPLDIYRFDYPPEVFGYRKSIYNLCFIAVLPEGQEPRIMEPDKCEAMRWATPEEALAMIGVVPHEGTERLIRKWQTFEKSKWRKE
jgi:8-oxo-dGTP pyrophosphatase MutT (NUDIX family)